jgi:transposase
MIPQSNGHAVMQAAPKQALPNPEVLARPTRRCFSAEYKRRIVQEAAECSEPGQIGALLRREGLYSSHLVEWRRQERLAQAGKQGCRHPSADVLVGENRTLRRHNASLQRRLAQAEVVIDLQKKVSELLGITLSAPESDEND